MIAKLKFALVVNFDAAFDETVESLCIKLKFTSSLSENNAENRPSNRWYSQSRPPTSQGPQAPVVVVYIRFN